MNQQANSGINERTSLSAGVKVQSTESSPSTVVQQSLQSPLEKEMMKPSDETMKQHGQVQTSPRPGVDHPDSMDVQGVLAYPSSTGVASSSGGLRGQSSNDDEDFCNVTLNDDTPQTTTGWQQTPNPEVAVDFGSAGSSHNHGNRRLNVEVKEDGEGNEQEYIQLEDDVFSLMIISEYTERSFWFAASIFAFQILILSLITIDLLDDDSLTDDGNPVNVPMNVDWQVWVAQILALVIAAVSQDDVRTSLRMITVGYYPALEVDHPGATRTKFVIANLCRFTEGIMSVVVAFIFIVQADNILDIFLNFAAVEFISNIDNLAYDLASHGYLGRFIQKKTEAMEEIQFPVQNPKRKWLVKLFFYIILFGLLAGWSVVRARQSNGYLLFKTSCSTLAVKFGDEVYELPGGIPVEIKGSFRESRVLNRFKSGGLDKPPPLFYGFFSGTYEAMVKSGGNRFVEKNDRPIYYERGIEDPTSGRFYYCEDEMAWVFSIPALGDHIPSTTRTENCDWGWLAKSPQTDAHRLEDVESFVWKVWTGEKLETSDILRIQCTECDRDTDCSVRNGFCNTDEGVCECYDNWGGFDCHVHLPYCDTVRWIHFGESSVDYDESELFQLFRDGGDGSPLLYDRPVYRLEHMAGGGEAGRCNGDMLEDLLFYTGRRWFVTSWCAEERESMLDDLFHVYWDNVLILNAQQVSAPTDSETPVDKEVEWIELLSGSGDNGPMGATLDYYYAAFECGSVNCNIDGICGRSGTCEEGQCICDDWYGGRLCEFSPDGHYAHDQYSAAQEYLSNTIRDRPTPGYELNTYHEKWFAPVIDATLHALVDVRLDIDLDNYPEETGFMLYETESLEIIDNVYNGEMEGFLYCIHTYLLVPGFNYTFVIVDVWEDGLNSTGYSITALLPDGEQVLVQGDPDFGQHAVSTFVVPDKFNNTTPEDPEL